MTAHVVAALAVARVASYPKATGTSARVRIGNQHERERGTERCGRFPAG
jgi:hypothetical protein